MQVPGVRRDFSGIFVAPSPQARIVRYRKRLVDDDRGGTYFFLNKLPSPFFKAFCASSVARLVRARLATPEMSIRTCGAFAEPVMVAGKVTRPSCCV